MDFAFFVRKLLIGIALSQIICATGSGLVKKENVEWSLQVIHDVASKSLGELCVTQRFCSLSVPLDTVKFEPARQKADLAATLLQDLGVGHHNGEQRTCLPPTAFPLFVSRRSNFHPLKSYSVATFLCFLKFRIILMLK
ncbi:hypothetical protein Trydic_g13791 [Trypoxylus dichotomus]